jgi:hypothetical protein
MCHILLLITLYHYRLKIDVGRCLTYGTRALNGAWKDFLGTCDSLLSQFLNSKSLRGLEFSLIAYL